MARASGPAPASRALLAALPGEPGAAPRHVRPFQGPGPGPPRREPRGCASRGRRLKRGAGYGQRQQPAEEPRRRPREPGPGRREPGGGRGRGRQSRRAGLGGGGRGLAAAAGGARGVRGGGRARPARGPAVFLDAIDEQSVDAYILQKTFLLRNKCCRWKILIEALTRSTPDREKSNFTNEQSSPPSLVFSSVLLVHWM
ncbi:cystin-1 isoform X2 [Alligator mississippiensis]|uniref:cystin-1 isoform X2 n=1 Tax=Alligator mississippiensis TaxID=8496 RepID=UPI002877E8A2|nr:cystin-1 isoform X2 [Alligator mississippiensis]